MRKKRRNPGRARMNSCHEHMVNCSNCGKLVPGDKAINPFLIKNIVSRDAELPNDSRKTFYCVSSAARVTKWDLRRQRVPLSLRARGESDARTREEGSRVNRLMRKRAMAERAFLKGSVNSSAWSGAEFHPLYRPWPAAPFEG
jgi:ribosomal protein S26